jgi:prolyl-tRNA synthetase
MKDGYSFHNNVQESYDAYLDLYNRYVNIFNDIGIGHKCVAAAGDSGPIGGRLNHEIILLEEEGDTTVWYQQVGLNNYNDLEDLDNNCGTVEKHLKKDNIHYKEARGIELGHLFNYEDKYGKDMDAGFINNKGQKEFFYGGCYGIGVTRLIAAVVQTHSDDQGIIWPIAIAPFTYHLVFNNDKLYDAMKVYKALGSSQCLMDDRDESMGVKLMDADLLGMPYQIILGKNLEIKNRSTGQVQSFDHIQSLVDFITS